MKIVKASRLHNYIEQQIKELGLETNDLVLVHIDKIEGSPTQWLQDNILKQSSEKD